MNSNAGWGKQSSWASKQNSWASKNAPSKFNGLGAKNVGTNKSGPTSTTNGSNQNNSSQFNEEEYKSFREHLMTIYRHYIPDYDDTLPGREEEYHKLYELGKRTSSSSNSAGSKPYGAFNNNFKK